MHPGPLGDYESVHSELKEMESKDPLAPNVRLAQIESNLAAGGVTDAVVGAEAAQLRSSLAPMVMLSPARAYVAEGNIAKARELTDAVRSTGLVSTPGVMLPRFVIDEAGGGRADAQALLIELQDKDVDGQAKVAYLIGEGYKTLGDCGRRSS